MPLRARLGRVASVALAGTEKNLEVAATMVVAFRGGGSALGDLTIARQSASDLPWQNSPG